MPITIREARSSKADRDWIEETYGEYLADLTADTTGVYPSLTVTGQSVTEIIQGWFHDDRCTAFMVLREQEPVGFAVVQRSLSSSEDPKRNYRLTEFFIRKPFRSKGVGRGAAMLIFARYAGEWTVAEQSRNPGAIRFWRRVVSEFTNGKFQREARAGRDRAPVHERGAGARSGALTSLVPPDGDLDFPRPRDLEEQLKLELLPLDQRLLEPHQHHVHAVRRELDRLVRVHVQHRDLAHARHAVLDLGAVNLDLRRDRRGDLQESVRFSGVVLQREVHDADRDAGRRRARPGVA